MTGNRALLIAITVILLAALITGITLMGVYIRLPSAPDYDNVWTEIDIDGNSTFDIDDIASIEMTGDDFKILQLTDLHYRAGYKIAKSDELIRRTVEIADPDMIVITGDLVMTVENNFYVEHVAELFADIGIPWAVTFGNHDDEGRADKYYMGEIYENAEHSLYKNGPVNIGGLGNYAVNITRNGAPYYSLIMMDSGTYIDDYPEFSYGTFEAGQIYWYDWLQRGLIASGYEKSLMFFHIPLPEFKIAYDEWQINGSDPATGFGERREDECHALVNMGMFDKIKQLGATTDVFVGHDHVNNYSVEYMGVGLHYGVKSTRQIYHDDDMIGGKLITISGEVPEVVVENILLPE